jgi:adenylylsulfate kinase
MFKNLKEGFVIWLTGLPGSGKTTVAKGLKKYFKDNKYRIEVLDGDFVRKNLSPDLGFSKEEREQHNKRVIFLSNLLAENGVIVIVSLISPYRKVRDLARSKLKKFVEVFVKCSIEKCIERDPKGLYKKALKGEIKDMTGIQHPYEEPLNPEVIVDTEIEETKESVSKILLKIKELDYLI